MDMFLLIFIILVAVVSSVVLYRLSTKINKPKPSDFFPWNGMIASLIKKNQNFSQEQVSILKEYYNNIIVKFFQKLNKKTQNLVKYEDSQFEKIAGKIITKLKLKTDGNVSKINLRNAAIAKLQKIILAGDYFVKDKNEIDYYKTHKKYMNELKPFLNIFYKGPPLPTSAPIPTLFSTTKVEPTKVKPSKVEPSKVEPSDLFPYKGKLDSIVSSAKVEGGKPISESNINTFKGIYDENIKKFFKLMNKETQNLVIFKPGQFEDIIQRSFGKVRDDFFAKASKSSELKEFEKVFQSIIMTIMTSPETRKTMVSGPMGPDLYKTYKKYVSEFEPLMKLYYKGPAFPTESTIPKVVCKKDEKEVDNKCVKIRCPWGYSMTGLFVNDTTECTRKQGNKVSSKFFPNQSLEELRCPRMHKAVNGKCVKVACPQGYFYFGDNGMKNTVYCKKENSNNKIKPIEFNMNDLPEA